MRAAMAVAVRGGHRARAARSMVGLPARARLAGGQAPRRISRERAAEVTRFLLLTTILAGAAGTHGPAADISRGHGAGSHRRAGDRRRRAGHRTDGRRLRSARQRRPPARDGGWCGRGRAARGRARRQRQHDRRATRDRAEGHDRTCCVSSRATTGSRLSPSATRSGASPSRVRRWPRRPRGWTESGPAARRRCSTAPTPASWRPTGALDRSCCW